MYFEKPYLMTSTTKVNAVKNFNLRSEKKLRRVVISEFTATSRRSKPGWGRIKRNIPYQHKACYEVPSMPSLSGTKGREYMWLPPQGRRFSFPVRKV